MTSSVEQLTEIPYPAVTTCPGRPFNYSAMQELGLNPNIWSEDKLGKGASKLPTNQSELQTWWDLSTFPCEALVAKVANVIDMEARKFDKRIQSFSFPTLFLGLCYMYTFSQPYVGSQRQYLYLELKVPSDMGHLKIFLHRSSDEKWQQGLNLWTKAPHMFEVTPDSSTTIS